MKFSYTKDLRDYMEKKYKKNIIVEVITCNADIDVTELHVFLADDKTSNFYKVQKKYKGIETEVGEVLLPPYRLEYKDEIVFDLKKVLCFKMVKYEGIHL